MTDKRMCMSTRDSFAASARHTLPKTVRDIEEEKKKLAKKKGKFDNEKKNRKNPEKKNHRNKTCIL